MSVGASDLEKLVVRIVGDASNFNKVGKDVEKTMDKMSRQATKLGMGLSAGVTLPLLGISAVASKTFLGFNDKMVKSTAIMGNLSETTITAMEDQAIALSRTGVSSAEDMAEAYFFLASAGLDAEQSIAALPQVQAFAAAGAFDLATATDLATDAQSALGLTVKDADQNLTNLTRVTDVLVAANTKANASVEQFAKSLTSKAGAALANVNKSIEEGVAVLAVYADKGTKAAKAGEFLNTFLRETQRQARENAGSFKELGVVLHDSKGELLPMANMVESLEGALEGLSTKEREAALDMLGFKAEAQAAIIPLLGMSGRLRTLTSDFEDVNGITKTVAGKQLKSFSAQLKIGRNNVTAIALDIGKVLVPNMMRMNQLLIDGADLWFSLDESTKKMIITIGGLAAALGPTLLIGVKLLPMMNLLAGGIKLVTMGVWSLTRSLIVMAGTALVPVATAVGTFLAPLLPFIAAGAAIVAIIAAIATIIIGPQGMVDAFHSATSVMGTWVTMGKGFIHNFQENIVILGKWLMDTFTKIWNNAGKAVKIVFTNIIKMVIGMQRIQLRLFAIIAGFIVRIVQQIPAMIMTVVQFLFDMFIKFVKWVPTAIVTAFTTVGNIIVTIFKTIFNLVTKIVGTVISTIAQMFTNFWTMGFIDAVKAGISLAWKAFTGFFKMVGDALYKLVTLDFDFLKKLGKDFEAGKSGEDVMASIMGVIKEEIAGMDLDFGGSLGIQAPEFNLDLPNTPEMVLPPEATLEIPELPALEEAKKQEKVKQNMEDKLPTEKKKLEAEASNKFSAVEAGSAEAFRQARMSEQGGGSLAGKQLVATEEVAANTKKLLDKQPQPNVSSAQDIKVSNLAKTGNM